MGRNTVNTREVVSDPQRRKTTEQSRKYGLIKKFCELIFMCRTKAVLLLETTDGVITSVCNDGNWFSMMEKMVEKMKDTETYSMHYDVDAAMDEFGDRKVVYAHPSKKRLREDQEDSEEPHAKQFLFTKTRTTSFASLESNNAEEDQQSLPPQQQQQQQNHVEINFDNMTETDMNSLFDYIYQMNPQAFQDSENYTNIEQNIDRVIPNPIALAATAPENQTTLNRIDTSKRFGVKMNNNEDGTVTIQTQQTVEVRKDFTVLANQVLLDFQGMFNGIEHPQPIQ